MQVGGVEVVWRDRNGDEIMKSSRAARVSQAVSSMVTAARGSRVVSSKSCASRAAWSHRPQRRSPGVWRQANEVADVARSGKGCHGEVPASNVRRRGRRGPTVHIGEVPASGVEGTR
nr:unnamed protein product [Digitaria exilis]